MTKKDKEYYEELFQDYSLLQEDYAKLKEKYHELEQENSTLQDQPMIAELDAPYNSRGQSESDPDLERQHIRELTKQITQAANEQKEQMMKEIDELKEELRYYQTDIDDLQDLPPEQSALVRAALQKQAKMYRQREKDLQKRIQELEAERADPVDVNAAIDEAVREVMKRASDIQMRLRAENSALKKRILQLDPNAEDDFETIEDIIQRTIEGSDMSFHEMEQELEVLRGQLLVYQSVIDRLKTKTDKDNDDYEDRIKELEQELETLRQEIGYCLSDHVETLDDSNYVYEARMRGVIHYTPERMLSMGAEQLVPTRLSSDMETMRNKTFEYQRDLKRMTFVNQRYLEVLRQNGLEGKVGISSEDLLEAEKINDQFWSDKSDLILENSRLREANARLQQQIDHLPSEARAYNEQIKRRRESTEQPEEMEVMTTSAYGPMQRKYIMTPVSKVPGDSELERRNQELAAILAQTKSRLMDVNEEFRQLNEMIDRSDLGESADLATSLSNLMAVKERLERENKAKEGEIAEARALIAQREEQLEEKKKESFKLTYEAEDSLYLCVGYGEQATGGYSISVNELYLSENAIYFDTNLIGPEPSEPAAEAASYPYLAVKTAYLDKPVVFQ